LRSGQLQVCFAPLSGRLQPCRRPAVAKARPCLIQSCAASTLKRWRRSIASAAERNRRRENAAGSKARTHAFGRAPTHRARWQGDEELDGTQSRAVPRGSGCRRTGCSYGRAGCRVAPADRATGETHIHPPGHAWGGATGSGSGAHKARSGGIKAPPHLSRMLWVLRVAAINGDQ
jgi:hypothetical protein